MPGADITKRERLAIPQGQCGAVRVILAMQTRHLIPERGQLMRHQQNLIAILKTTDICRRYFDMRYILQGRFQ